MSVEKFNNQWNEYNPNIEHEAIPYAQININVVQQITDMQAGFVWVYLQSKPANWRIIKEHIKNHFKIGNAKIKKIFAYLHQHNLIEYIQENGENGQFGKHDIRVLNGSKFKSYPLHCTGGSENRPAVNRTTGSGLLHIKENTNKEKELKSIVHPEAARDDDFDEFWKQYPNKKNRKAALQKWRRLPADTRKLILERLPRQIREDVQWQNKQYVPLATTYLNNERWEDEIMTATPQKLINNEPKRTEIKSTVAEWAPGHPGYDAIHAFKPLTFAQNQILGVNPCEGSE